MYLSSSRRIFILPNFNPYFSSESHRSRLCCSAFVLAGSIPTNKYRTHDRGTLEVTKDEENPISRRGRSLFAAAFDEVHSKFERPIAFKRLIARFRAWSAARSIARIHRLAISTSGFSNEKFSSPLSLFLFLSFSPCFYSARVLFVFTPFAFIYYQSVDTSHGHQFGLTPAQQQFSNRCHFSRYSCYRCLVVAGIAGARI